MLYTLLEEDLIASLEKTCRELGLPCMSVLGPILRLFQSYLGAETILRAGAQHVLNAEYFQRIDALNYSMMHDDGQHVAGLDEADVVLIGVSRTSKTPTSIYLANRGVKTGNVPLVPGVPLAPEVEKLTRPLVIGLTASPERIVQIRENRLLGLNAHRDDDQYIDKTVGGRGSRLFAAVVRQAQLADHRRDAALDRGNRRRSDEASGRAPAQNRSRVKYSSVSKDIHAALDCSATVGTRARKATFARKILAAAGLRFGIRPAQIDERAMEAKAGVVDAAAAARAIGAGQGGCGSRRRKPVIWFSAAIRPWRSGRSALPNRANRDEGSQQLRALRGKTHALHSALALVRDGTVAVRDWSIPRG